MIWVQRRACVAEPFDVYADTFQISTNPWAVTLNLNLTGALPVAPGTPPTNTLVGTVRMGLEAVKVLAFLLHRQIEQHERALGITVEISQQVLNAVQIGPEDWQEFWRRT
jgi:hypothetical protein